MIRVNRELLDYVIKLKDTPVGDRITELEAVKGEKILLQKTHVHAVYLIKEGLTKCYQTIDTGNDFIQEFFGAGEVFGEIEVLTDAISFCTIEALGPLRYFKIPKTAFLELIEQDPKFNSLLLRLLASNVRYAALRHSYNQTHTLEDNIKRLLSEFPQLFEKIAKHDIANYLGISIRSLNRVIQTLES
ncbi:Crp/Fnr family transcriptional regulator [Flagellimonas sp. DF-77]|uniref:Crp/Fnr family transcriptional regulator n=1 Tax=Flagellimonas algarum TaxID=3230298 RepID=UPI0033914539